MGFLDRFRRRDDSAAREHQPSHQDGQQDGQQHVQQDGRQPADQQAAAPVDPAKRTEQLAQATEHARALIDSGFVDLPSAEETLTEVYLYEADNVLSETEVRELVRRAWAERLARQREWPDEGDYARVAAAFDELDRSGIVARMDFTCCQTCGHAEIGDERDKNSRGYTFFHRQDAERMVPGEPSLLYLSFGSFGTGQSEQATAAEVAAEVAAALRRQRLTVDWDGNVDARIAVTGLDWRKRLPVN